MDDFEQYKMMGDQENDTDCAAAGDCKSSCCLKNKCKLKEKCTAYSQDCMSKADSKKDPMLQCFKDLSMDGF